MKKWLILLFFLPLAINAQETTYRYFSYTEFFKMIEEEKDSVFRFENAIIQPDLEMDSLFMMTPFRIPVREELLIVDKELILDNVHFQNPIYFSPGNYSPGYLAKIHFTKNVSIFNTAALHFSNCQFDGSVQIGGTGFFCSLLDQLEQEQRVIDNIRIVNSEFRQGLSLFFNCNYQESNGNTTIQLWENVFWPNDEGNITRLRGKTSLSVIGHQFGDFLLYGNEFKEEGFVFLMTSGNQLVVTENRFGNSLLNLITGRPESNFFLDIEKNEISKKVIFQPSGYSPNQVIEFSQFKGGIRFGESYGMFLSEQYPMDSEIKRPTELELYHSDSLQNIYEEVFLVENSDAFLSETTNLGMLFNHYKNLHQTKFANQIYIRLKDLETNRLGFEYKTDPSFDTYFTWKINQFLKLFSDYGTKPSKAIVFSVYVILAFSLVYLFFPNSWDAHGKNRIVDRYRFFFKYLQRNSGMHEVYLEEKKSELLGYEEFKSIITNSEKSVPRFFSATALPLYHWAISGTRISAKILSKIDILKGTWEDLPAGQKAWKSFLLVGGFLIALVYDLLIKVLNALMLSINTFTTLGFGEIPIKGLPRYLAIIQGFIGWFMLTIFSVSLISQLMN